MNELELRRRAMMSDVKEPRLPDEYQEVRYLESTGTQYINTQFKLKEGDEFKTKSSSNSTSIYNTVIGAYKAIQLYYNDTIATLWCPSDGWAIIKYGKRSNIELNKTYVHRCVLVTMSRQYGKTGYRGFEIFAYNSDYKFVGKINYVIWYRDGAIIHSFVPCCRKADNKPGMYDIITNTFFTNSGTGEFTVGPDVN